MQNLHIKQLGIKRKTRTLGIPLEYILVYHSFTIFCDFQSMHLGFSVLISHLHHWQEYTEANRTYKAVNNNPEIIYSMFHNWFFFILRNGWVALVWKSIPKRKGGGQISKCVSGGPLAKICSCTMNAEVSQVCCGIHHHLSYFSPFLINRAHVWQNL